jgi:hypothetical protein
MAGIDVNAIACLHLNGTNGGTSFPDASQYALSFSGVGNAQTSTAQSKFNGSSLLLDGSGDRVHTADFAALDVGTGNYTVDFWVYFVSLASGLCCFTEWGTYSSAGFLIQLSGTTLQVYVNNSPRNWTWSPSTGTWYHFAHERYNGNLYAYVGGTSLGAGQASTENISGSSSGLSIGDTHSLADRAVNGHMQEYRASDISRYSGSNFTPETSPYSSGSASTTLPERNFPRGVGRGVMRYAKEKFEKAKNGLWMPDRKIIVPGFGLKGACV